MTNENDSNDPTGRPPGQPPLQPPATPATPLQDALPDSGKGKAAEERSETKELAREFRIAEKWVIGTNIVLAIIGSIALCIYYGQLRVMRGQLGEIIKQYPEIQKSARAAESAANSASDQIKLSREAIHSSERPWITDTAKNIPPLTPNVKFTMYIQILNSGKSPALQARVVMQSRYFKKFPLPNPPYDLSVGTPAQSLAILTPNVPIALQLPDTLLFDEPFRKIQSGEVAYFIYGQIHYTDAFSPSHEHVTHFCTQYRPDPTRTLWVACPFYNDAD